MIPPIKRTFAFHIDFNVSRSLFWQALSEPTIRCLVGHWYESYSLPLNSAWVAIWCGNSLLSLGEGCSTRERILESMLQCLRRCIISRDPIVSIMKQLHVDIFQFVFIKFRNILHIPQNGSVSFLQWMWTSYFSNSTGSSVTGCSDEHILDISNIVLLFCRHLLRIQSLEPFL